MIFAHTHTWVADRSPQTGAPKTLTSRLTRAGDVLATGICPDGELAVVQVLRGGRPFYAVGAERLVQPGRGEFGIGRIRITGIALAERAGEISPPEALAEGFATVAGFQRVWSRMYGPAALDQPCYRIRFVWVGPVEASTPRRRRPRPAEEPAAPKPPALPLLTAINRARRAERRAERAQGEG